MTQRTGLAALPLERTQADTTQTTSILATGGRLFIAALFLMSGLAKLASPAATQGYIAAVGLPLPLFAYLGAVFIEVGGGVLLAIGYRVKIVSLLIAAFTLVAAIAFHRNFADQNQLIHFFKNIAIAGGLLQVAAFGGGPFSLDARRSVVRTNP